MRTKTDGQSDTGPTNPCDLSEEERDYIIETYGQEPEDLPNYEVIEAINERREVN